MDETKYKTTKQEKKEKRTIHGKGFFGISSKKTDLNQVKTNKLVRCRD